LPGATANSPPPPIPQSPRRWKTRSCPTATSASPTTASASANAAAFAALKGVGFTPSPCETGFAYGNAWAARMPPPFRLPQGAALVEAAGNDRPGCRARMAAFRVATTPPSVIAAIRAGAMQAGYTALVQVRGADQVVAGRRSADGATYYAIATPQAQGSEVSLLTAAKSPLR